MSRMPWGTAPLLKLAVVLAVFLIWSWCARPLMESAWVAARRLAEMVSVQLASSRFAQPREQIIDRMVAHGQEIDRYLTDLQARLAAQQTDSWPPGNRKPWTHDDLQPMRDEFARSLHFPPPGFEGSSAGQIEERSLGEDDLAWYSEWTIPVMPGLHARGIYARPKAAAAGERLPLVIAAYGRHGAPAEDKVRAAPRSMRDMASEPLQRGYAVWIPVYSFYGPDEDDTLRFKLAVRAVQSGTTLPAIEVATLTRSLDAITQQRNDIDPQRIAMMGFSYGGFFTLYAAALEPRIAVALVMGYFNDREKVLGDNEPYAYIDWRFDRSLALWRDPEVAALVVPRALYVQFSSGDPLFPAAGARTATEQARVRFEQAGRADNFRSLEIMGRHECNTGPALDFVADVWSRSSKSMAIEAR